MARRLFLERRTYREHRLKDAARLLPVLGLILIFGPIFIREGGGEAAPISGTLVYYFAIWLALIGMTALVGRALNRVTPPGQDAKPSQGAADPPKDS